MIEVPKPIRNSEYREDIDKMLAAGEPYTAISNWLRNNGEVVSRNVLAKYHKFCFNINEEAAKVYTQADSEAKLKAEAVKGASTLSLYDKFIAAAIDVNPSMLDDKTKVELAVKMAKQREDLTAYSLTMITKPVTDLCICTSIL